MSAGNLAWARAYAALGWRVFPVYETAPGGGACACGNPACESPGKHPRVKAWQHEATCDPEKIAAWWARWPAAHVGVACGAASGLVVVDIDPHRGGEERAVWPDLAPPGPRVLTGGGGLHVYCAHPGAAETVPNSAGVLAPGVDVRGDGGYVVAPPSGHANGGTYEWEGDYTPRLAPCPLPDAVGRRAAGTPAAALPGQLRVLAGHLGGRGRNVTLAEQVGVWLAQGERDAPALLDAAREFNFRFCEPPLPDAEVRRTVASVAATDRHNHPAAWPGLAEPKASASAPAPSAECPPWPDALRPAADSFAAQVVAWNAATARKPQPVLAQGAALALLGAVLGRRVQGWTGLRTNGYHLGIAPSGSGKDWVFTQFPLLLAAAGADSILGGSGFASHAGLLHAVARQPAPLFLFDEIGRELKIWTDPRAPGHVKKIGGLLIQLHSRAGSTLLGHEYSAGNVEQRNRVDLVQPCVTLYGASVPDHVFAALSREDVFDGFLARFLLWEADCADPEDQPADPLTPIPPPLVAAVRRARALPENPAPAGDLDRAPAPRPVFPTPAAELVFEGFAKKIRAEKAAARARRSGADALWARAWEHAARLAVLEACGRALLAGGDFAPAVEARDADFAVALATHLVGRMIVLADANVAASEADGGLKAVWRAIHRAGPSGATRGEIGDACPMLRRRDLKDALDELVERGRVVVVAKPGGGAGRPATAWVALEYVCGD